MSPIASIYVTQKLFPFVSTRYFSRRLIPPALVVIYIDNLDPYHKTRRPPMQPLLVLDTKIVFCGAACGGFFLSSINTSPMIGTLSRLSIQGSARYGLLPCSVPESDHFLMESFDVTSPACLGQERAAHRLILLATAAHRLSMAIHEKLNFPAPRIRKQYSTLPIVVECCMSPRDTHSITVWSQ